MNLNNYTIKSQEAIQQAQQIAQSFEHQQIENEHFFKGIFKVDENVLPFILKKLNVNISILEQALDKQLESFPKVSGGELMLSREASKTLNEASIIAKKMKDDYVSIEHLILAVFKSNSKIHYKLEENKTINLVNCEFFTTNIFEVKSELEKDYCTFDSFIILMCVEGTASINIKNCTEKIEMGETFLIPANVMSLTLESENAKLLEVYIK